MAMITPASDAFPSMIPPSDFPPSGKEPSPKHIRKAREKASNNTLMSIEVEEIRVLTEFLAAFCRYMNDRFDPTTTADVLQRYYAAMRFYEG